MINEADIQRTIRAYNWLIGYKRVKGKFSQVPALERQKIKIIDTLRKVMKEESKNESQI